MSVKTTIELTRARAIDMYVDMMLVDMKRYFKSLAEELTDEELGDEMDKKTTNEFCNYLVIQK